MPHKKTLNWYEASLSVQERKVRGHFSTPPLLVNAILDACGYTADADLSHLRVLDPACGSGNFLVGAAQRMVASGKQSGMSTRQLQASVQRNLWGLDPDPVACFLAEMQVHSFLVEQGIVRNKQPRLHIHQADGLTLPWEQAQRESVDLFLANPPYLAAKNADLSGYRPSQQGVGQGDSYLFFLQLALQVVRPNGWIGLVLPDPVLARANATHERQRLLEETTVHSLWHLSHVFPAYVGAVVIIAQKRPPTRSHQIAWVRKKWRKDDKTFSASHDSTSCIAQSTLHAQSGAELRYLLGTEQGTLIERLHLYMTTNNEAHTSHLDSLGRFVSIRRGEELGKKSDLLSATPLDTYIRYPLLLGGVDVRPYATPQGLAWIAEKTIGKPLERYLTPKLLVVKSTNALQATLDMKGHVVLQTLYLLTLKSSSQKLLKEQDALVPEYELNQLYFLLALLNSRLLQRYVYVLYTAYKLVQPQIEQHVLAHLPIPVIAPEMQHEIIARAKQIMLACSNASSVVELKQQFTFLYEEQERAICALYEHALHL